MVEVGLLPNPDFVSFLELNPGNEIIIGSRNCTSIKGVFSAGDVANVMEKHIIIACGEEAKAALSVYHYLSTHTH